MLYCYYNYDTSAELAAHSNGRFPDAEEVTFRITEVQPIKSFIITDQSDTIRFKKDR